MIKLKKPYQALIIGISSGLGSLVFGKNLKTAFWSFVGGTIGALLILYIFYDDKNNYRKPD